MKIALSRLLSDALQAEIPRAAGVDGAAREPHRFEVAHVVSLRGTLETSSHATAFTGVAAESADLVTLATFVGSTAIRARATTLRELGGDLSLADSGTRAALRASEISSHGAAVHVGDGMAFEMEELAASAAQLRLGPLAARGDAVRAAKLRVRIGDFEAAMEAVHVRGLTVESTADGTAFGASEVVLEGVTFDAGGAAVRLERATLANPRWASGALTFARASISRAEIDVPELASGREKEGGSNTRPPLDLAFLDKLSGHADVDVHVDARLPVIQRRSAVHKFRVPIAHGVIDFKELERNLSFLEDAVLDFEWKGDRLILEKDIPLVPFDNETLVSWALDAEDQALAKREKARLRTLARPELPSRPAAPRDDEAKKPGFQLERVDLDPISIALSLEGPAHVATGGVTTTLGTNATPGIAAIAVHGAVRYRHERAPEPGAIEITVEGVHAGETSLSAAGRTIRTASASIGQIARATVAFAGLSPSSLVADVRDILLGETTVAPAETLERG